MRARAAISNIAWPAQDDAQAVTLAAELGFSGIELAPGKVFGPLDAIGSDALRRYRRDLGAQGLSIPALQAILFGVTDAHLFESEATRARLGERLTRVAEVAGELGAGACVFGSPALRDPGQRSIQEAMDIAANFFARLAPRFVENGTVLAFEANPSIYQCRFVTCTSEAIDLVKRVDTPGFGLQLDMGTVFANGESADTVIAAGRIARHCHVSEPQLVPLGTGGHDHQVTGAALRDTDYDGWISIEMRAVDNWISAMETGASIVRKEYI